MSDPITTTSNGKATLATDPPFEQQHPNGGDAYNPLGKEHPTKTASDLLIYRMVVAFLGLTLLVTVAGLIVLLAIGKTSVPDGLIALGAATVGGLAGFLAPSPVSASSQP